MVDEVSKAVGQWIVGNLGWSVIIVLFLLTGFFKIVKIEVNPLGWLIGWIGKAFTKDVRKDISDLKADTASQFDNVRKDRAKKIEELKTDYNDKISELRKDLDVFEARTNAGIEEMRAGTDANCSMLKARLNEMEKSNDMQTVRQIKAHVLDFANSCLNKRRHTKQDFDNIIHENEEYEKLVKKYGLVNDVYAEDYKFIMKIYHRCQEEGSFLKESDADT